MKRKRVWVDPMSCLPDDVLSLILSHLPLKVAVRTSALSKSWRLAWTAAAIDLDATASSPLLAGALHPLDEITDIVDSILSHHRGPLRTFRVSGPRFHRWIETATAPARQLRELHVANCLFVELHPCLLRCAALRTLDLRSCTLPNSRLLLPRPSFAGLTHLSLHHTCLPDDALAALVSACQLLECLCLENTPDCCTDMKVSSTLARRIVICSPNLRTLTAYGLSWSVKELVVDQAPNLEHLMLGAWTSTTMAVTVQHAAKLKLLGFVDATTRSFNLGEARFQMGKSISSGTLLYGLKTLAIKTNFNFYEESKMVSNFLKCFPCLEKLDIQIHYIPACYIGQRDFDWDEEGLYNCVLFHLDSITVKGFTGSRHELCFINFCVLQAQVLKMMTFICEDTWSANRKEATRCKLCLENAASPSLRVDFQDEGDAEAFSTWEFLIQQRRPS